MRFKEFLAIVELRTKIVSISSLLIGGLIALKLSLTGQSLAALSALHNADLTKVVAVLANDGAVFGWGVYILMFLSALAVDMGTTAFNSFFDYWNGTDKKATNRESDKVLVHKGTPPGYALIVAILLYAFAMISGVVIAALTSWWVLLAGAVCMAVGFFYTAGPRPISSTPLGEIFAGGFLGFVLIELTAFVSTGVVHSDALLLGIPSSLFIASILTVNNTNDIVGDTAAGRKTLSILIGKSASKILIPVLGAAAYLSIGILALTHPIGSIFGLPDYLNALRLIPLLVTLALSLKFYRAMFKRDFSHATKGPNMGAISKSFMFFSIGELIALLI